MKMRIACGLAVYCAGFLLTGCSASRGLVRGQSPDQAQLAGRATVEQTGFHGDSHLFANNHRLFNGDHRLFNGDHHYREDPGACQGPNCPNGTGEGVAFLGHGHHGNGGSCPTCRNGDNGFDDGQTWHPTHRHWFVYKQPHDLVYPPANTPAAIVQYPYYNVKGPSDFFMK